VPRTQYSQTIAFRVQVLEWVEHSMPFGDFIIDKSGKTDSNGNKSKGVVGAHSRYYPDEWSSPYCRDILSNLRAEFTARDKARDENEARDEEEARDDQKKLRAAFDLICERYSPVFRYFFVEKFAQPEAWYAAKMRYTRSVAVSSIVGHVLGIGKPGFSPS
jgi:serine-protein kinase ATM